MQRPKLMQVEALDAAAFSPSVMPSSAALTATIRVLPQTQGHFQQLRTSSKQATICTMPYLPTQAPVQLAAGGAKTLPSLSSKERMAQLHLPQEVPAWCLEGDAWEEAEDIARADLLDWCDEYVKLQQSRRALSDSCSAQGSVASLTPSTTHSLSGSSSAQGSVSKSSTGSRASGGWSLFSTEADLTEVPTAEQVKEGEDDAWELEFMLRGAMDTESDVWTQWPQAKGAQSVSPLPVPLLPVVRVD